MTKFPMLSGWCVFLFGVTLNYVVLAQDNVLSVGSNDIEIQIDGKTRSYLAQVPNSYTPANPAPLVVVLHGTGGTPATMLQLGHFYKHVELNGYIAVAPRSIGSAFNDGSGRGGADVKNIDDVAFIEAVIEDIRS